MKGVCRRANRARLAVTLGVLTLLLALLSCSGPAQHSMLGDSSGSSGLTSFAPDALQSSLPPLPLDNGDRGTSASQLLSHNGNLTFRRSAGVSDQGNGVNITAPGTGIAWAMYEFSPASTLVYSAVFTGNCPAGSSDWIAIGNYSTHRWDFRGPYPLTHGAIAFETLDSGNYVSPAGHTYLLALAYNGGSFSLSQVDLNADDGVVPSYSIGGTVTKNIGGAFAGVTMTLNPGGTTTLTDAAGNYSFSGVFSGNYTVVPSYNGWDFAPLTQNVTVSTADVSAVDFVGTQQVVLYTVSGSVTKNIGGALPGVSMTLMPGGNTAMTDSQGAYSFTGLAPGSYTVTPALTGYVFTPPSTTIAVVDTDVHSVNFSGATQGGPPWTASGTVTDSLGNPVSGVTIFVPFDDLTTMTDAQGHYSFSGLANDPDFHLLASKNAYSFEPPIVFLNLNANVVQDFVATAETLPTNVSYAFHMKKQVLEAMCTSCHSSTLTGGKRHGAPLAINFDTYDGTTTKEKQKSNATCQDGSMPHADFGSLSCTPYQKQLFQKWADQSFAQ